MERSEENQVTALKCPNCGGSAITTSYFTGEIYCTICGLVLG